MTPKKKRYVQWDGSSYAVRSNKIEIPDLASMSRFSALQWLIENTHPRGYFRPNPLSGFGGAIAISKPLPSAPPQQWKGTQR